MQKNCFCCLFSIRQTLEAESNGKLRTFKSRFSNLKNREKEL
jgi:hypothetical protein